MNDGQADNPSDQHAEQPTEWDRALGDRLSKLRTVPVETGRLEPMLRAQIGPPLVDEPVERRLRMPWLRSRRAIAAGIAILVIISVAIMASSGGPVMASPNEMARMHEEVVNGQMPVMHVASIEEANRALAEQWPASPGIPAAPQEHVMACCMKSVKNKQVACVLLKGEDAPITLSVAKASDVKISEPPNATRNGIAYHVHAQGSLNMVSTERDGRFVCLIGRVPAERLMDIAVKLAF